MIKIYANTEINRRSSNQDRMASTSFGFRTGERVWLLAVSDGMGGLSDGERYAELALRELHRYIVDMILETEQHCTENHLRDRLPVLVEKLSKDIDSVPDRLNRNVLEIADRERIESGGATLSACIIADNSAIVFNTGDSPIYMLHDGTVSELSERHNVAERLVRNGELTRYCDEYVVRSASLYSYIGRREEVTCHSRTITLTDGDIIFIGSDGAFGASCCAADFQESLGRIGSLSSLPDRMFANARKNTSDNQTVIIAEYREQQQPEKKGIFSIFK